MKHKNEIIIAVIGLIGVIFTAVISNYDKLFSEKTIKSHVSPYENIDDLEQQIRYFVEISGFRRSLNEMEKITAEKFKAKYAASKSEINCMLDNRIQIEQLIELYISTTKKHITLEQIKDLNRVYTSESLQSFNKVSPLIIRELITGIEELHERMYIRNKAIIGTNENETKNSCPSL